MTSRRALYYLRLFLGGLILLALLVFPYASSALTVNPASFTVTCEPGQRTKVVVTVYADGVVTYSPRLVYASTTNGVVVQPERGVLNDTSKVKFTVECLKPGLYVYRLEFTEAKTGEGGVVARASSASTLRVLVKGVGAYIGFRKLNTTHIAVDVRLRAYGMMNVSANVVITVDGVNTMLLYNGTVRIPTVIEIPVPLYLLKRGGEVHVLGEALTVNRVYRFEAEKSLPPTPSINVTGSLAVNAPTLVVAMPPASLINVEGRLTLNGTHIPCEVRLTLRVGDTLFQREVNTLTPCNITVNGTVSVDPMVLTPYTVSAESHATVSCGYGLVHRSFHARLKILVIPVAFISLVMPIAVGIGAAVWRLARRRH